MGSRLVIPASGVPIGSVHYFGSTEAPKGFLIANGALLLRSSYAKLFAVIGEQFGAGDGVTTFALPDLRGEFVRGADMGRGVDAGRVFGSVQADELKSHRHTVTVKSFTTGFAGGFMALGNNSGTTTAANTSLIGGNETRPRNVALLACIKY